jgi:hypothetical protein
MIVVEYREFSVRLRTSAIPASEGYAWLLEAKWHNLRVLRALLCHGL